MSERRTAVAASSRSPVVAAIDPTPLTVADGGGPFDGRQFKLGSCRSELQAAQRPIEQSGDLGNRSRNTISRTATGHASELTREAVKSRQSTGRTVPQLGDRSGPQEGLGENRASCLVILPTTWACTGPERR